MTEFDRLMLRDCVDDEERDEYMERQAEIENDKAMKIDHNRKWEQPMFGSNGSYFK